MVPQAMWDPTNVGHHQPHNGAPHCGTPHEGLPTSWVHYSQGEGGLGCRPASRPDYQWWW